MKKDTRFSVNPILCTIIFALLVTAFFFRQRLIQTTPPPFTGFGTYAEVLEVEVHDEGILVTAHHLDGPSEYPGVQQYWIDDSTTISNEDRNALHNGSVGMLVWVEPKPFQKSDYHSSNEFIFDCQKFLIRQPTVPEWWDRE